MRLNPNHPALSEARTIHPKRVYDAFSFHAPIIKPVSMNSKLGKGKALIEKGRWKGMPMFSLTLEERATCPDTCLRWAECYGNGMPFAHRFKPGENLETRINFEIGLLARKFTSGFVVRLHILGDFYSVLYANLWANLLVKHPELHIFGYTSHSGGSIIGRKIILINRFTDRCWIRFSHNVPYNRAYPYEIFAGSPDKVSGVACPEQTEQSESCLTCGLCWTTKQTITFQDHDKLHKKRKSKSLEANKLG
jgi:hypothetical protein